MADRRSAILKIVEEMALGTRLSVSEKIVRVRNRTAERHKKYIHALIIRIAAAEKDCFTTNMAGSSTREVITLQFGHYSNFVGTHWWNIQESSFCYDTSASFHQEINHDVLFREGLTLLGEQTFTPRLLMFDLKGSLKNLPRYGTLYQDPSCSNEAAWSGKISVHETEPEPKNEFQMDLEAEEPQTTDQETVVTVNRTFDHDSGTLGPDSNSGVTEDNKNLREKYYNLDEDISVWSDFLGTCLHPKSIQLVGDFLHEGSANPFNVFGYGQGIVKDEHFYDEFENNLHFFVEECDRLQGFQIFADVYNGFGGLSSQVIEELQDDYGSKSFLTFGATPTQFPDATHKDTAHRILNTALSYGHLSQHSDMFIPLSLASEAWPRMRQAREFPLLNYKLALSYHTSAILGVCIDTITMPYRLLTAQAANMSSFIDSVAFGGRKIASLSSTFPLPVEETVPLASLLGSRLHRNGQELLQSVTPGVSNSSSLISQSAVIRGIPASLTHNPQRNVQTQNPSLHENPFEVCSATNEMVQTFLQNLHPQTFPLCWNVNQACMVKPPFPNIFASRVTSDGFVVDGYARPEGRRVNQTSVLSRVESNSGIAGMLLSLIQWAKKVNINKHHLFLESGTEAETFKEMLEDLTCLSERYENP